MSEFTPEDFSNLADLLRHTEDVAAVLSNNFNVILAALDRRRLVTVCDSCLQASCLQGEFYCENYRSAGTADLPVETLEELAREHADYWTPTDNTTDRED